MSRNMIIQKLSVKLKENIDLYNYQLDAAMLFDKIIGSRSSLFLKQKGDEKYQEAMELLTSLRFIDGELNELKQNNSDYQQRITHLKFLNILLLGVSLFLVNTIHHVFLLRNINTIYTLIITLIIGQFDAFVAYRHYTKLRYHNEEIKKYKDQEDNLQEEFLKKMEKLDRAISWYVNYNNYLTQYINQVRSRLVVSGIKQHDITNEVSLNQNKKKIKKR